MLICIYLITSYTFYVFIDNILGLKTEFEYQHFPEAF